MSKNFVQLVQSIDSVQVLAHEKSREQSTNLVSNRFRALGVADIVNDIFNLDEIAICFNRFDKFLSALITI